MKGVTKLVRLQVILLVLFIILKFTRPIVLKSNAFQWFKTILLSLPNFLRL